MPTGLRERKKARTKDQIAAAATALFLDRGYEGTTIAEVADRAEVAKMTVTNYFPQKEDLVFDRADLVVRRLADAVDARAHGIGIARAVRQTYLDGVDRRDPTLGFLGRRFAELVAGSPALLAREQQMFHEQEAALAATLTARFATSAADLRPALAAAQLAGTVRVLYFEGRRRLLADEATDDIARALRRAASTAFAAIEKSLPAAYR